MNVYEIVTTRVLDQLHKGTVPWRKPWSTITAGPRNLITNKPYRGINLFLLSFVVALIITDLSFTVAKYAYDNNLWMFSH